MVRPGTVLLVTNMDLKPSNLPAGDESNANWRRAGVGRKRYGNPLLFPQSRNAFSVHLRYQASIFFISLILAKKVTYLGNS